MRSVISDADQRRINWMQGRLNAMSAGGEMVRAFIDALLVAGDLSAYDRELVVSMLETAARLRDTPAEMAAVLGEFGSDDQRGTLQ